MTSRPQRPNLPASVKIMAFRKSSSNASVRGMQSHTRQVADATNSRSTQFQPIPLSQLTSTTETSKKASDIARVKKNENIPLQNFGPGKSTTQPQSFSPGKSATQPQNFSPGKSTTQAQKAGPEKNTAQGQSQRFKDNIVQPGQSTNSTPQGRTIKEYNKVQSVGQHGQNLNSLPQGQLSKEIKQNWYGQNASSTPQSPTSREYRMQNAIHHGPSMNSPNQVQIKQDNKVQSSAHHGQSMNSTTQGQANREFRDASVYKRNP